MVNLLHIGIFLILLGFVIVFISAFTSEKNNVQSAGGIFIGSIPVVGFASNKKLLWLLFGVGAAVFIISLVARRFL